jgi:hypothetical protein
MEQIEAERSAAFLVVTFDLAVVVTEDYVCHVYMCVYLHGILLCVCVYIIIICMYIIICVFKNLNQ